jgi:hypothetical protein
MAREATIDFPLECDKDAVLETDLPVTFVAWGTCCGAPDDLLVELEPHGGGAVIQGTLLIWPLPPWAALLQAVLALAGTDQFQLRPQWGALFGEPRGVPFGEYNLRVRRKKTRRTLAQRRIKVALARGPGISYPVLSNCPLPTTFTAWGTTGSPPVSSATMQLQPNGPVIPGFLATQLGGGGSTWAANFSVPPGSPYTLTVTDRSGPTSEPGLSVQ